MQDGRAGLGKIASERHGCPNAENRKMSKAEMAALLTELMEK